MRITQRGELLKYDGCEGLIWIRWEAVAREEIESKRPVMESTMVQNEPQKLDRTLAFEERHHDADETYIVR